MRRGNTRHPRMHRSQGEHRHHFGTARGIALCADGWHRAGHTTQQGFRNL